MWLYICTKVLFCWLIYKLQFRLSFCTETSTEPVHSGCNSSISSPFIAHPFQNLGKLQHKNHEAHTLLWPAVLLRRGGSAKFAHQRVTVSTHTLLGPVALLHELWLCLTGFDVAWTRQQSGQPGCFTQQTQKPRVQAIFLCGGATIVSAYTYTAHTLLRTVVILYTCEPCCHFCCIVQCCTHITPMVPSCTRLRTSWIKYQHNLWNILNPGDQSQDSNLCVNQ